MKNIILLLSFFVCVLASCSSSSKIETQIWKEQEKVVKGDKDYYVVKYGTWDTLRGDNLKITTYGTTFKKVIYAGEQIKEKDIHSVKCKNGVYILLHGWNSSISNIPNIPIDIKKGKNEYELKQIRKGKIELFYTDLYTNSLTTRSREGLSSTNYGTTMYFFIRKDGGTYNELFYNTELYQYIKDNKVASDMLTAKYNLSKERYIKLVDLLKIVDAYNAN